MTVAVTQSVADGIGTIRIDNPPVNALSAAVRRGLIDSVQALEADDRVRAILLLCAGRTFVAGADITEFGKPRQPPSLSEVCDAIEACTKPVVAALHGTALGGGFELALACHYRVASADASMGLPEIKLGLIPGAGGANRLARLAGVEEALKLTLSGEKIGAVPAHALGILDAIAEGDLKTFALDYGRRLAEANAPPRPTRAAQDRMADLKADLPRFESLAAAAKKKLKGQEAAAACVASMRRALTMEFDAAVEADRADFARLASGDQSKALRHLFFAERRAAKHPSLGEARPVRQVAIIGAGTMGSGIALAFATAGVPVRLIDSSDDAITRGIDRIASNLANSVKRGSLNAAEAEQRQARIVPSAQLADVGGADLAIEAVFEDMAVKKRLFADLERLCAADAILATNTSALDVDDIAAVLERPERFVGMHFFAPANAMRLIEVVRAARSSGEALATAIALAKAIGKAPVLSGNCDGFIGNRMVARRGAQAERLLQQGALPQDVDAAWRGFGFAMGPFETNDMSGLDVGYAIRKRRGTIFPIADAVAESGRLGQKTGAGYYRYEPRSRTPYPDPALASLIEGVSARLGIERRTMTAEDMVERMIFPIINEGARILKEGIAARASDIDVVWAYGYGFPKWRGGPLFYADQVGLPYVVERLTEFAAGSNDSSLSPAPLLVELAGERSTFAEYDSRSLGV